nr:EOG090X0439 [Cyclestheria hislopi]
MPIYLNKMQEAEDKICQLLNTVRKIIQQFDHFIDPGTNSTERSEALELWSAREFRVVHSLVNCALLQKSFHNAVRLVHQCLQRPTCLKGPMYSILGRVYLLLGDVHRAQQALNLANDSRDSSQTASSIATLIDAALIAIAQNAFPDAYNYFKEALALEPDNPMLVNNAAVCLLYMGRMQDAMMMLEENLGTKPNAMIHDPTILNVCTLYELESSLTMQRKLGMLRLASQWRADSLNASCFKLQN